MNLQALKLEINGDPIGRGYAGMTDAQVASSLMDAADRAVQVRVSHTDLMKWAAAGRMKKLRDGEDNADASLASMSSVALALLRDGMTEFDTNDNGNIALLDALVAGGVLASGDKDALMALGAKTVSRAAELGLGTVYWHHVEAARAA